MTNAGALASLLLIAILLWSGLEKLRTVERTSVTFSMFQRWIAPRIAVMLLATTELLCAMGLLVAPSSPVTLLSVIGLATIFAAGGVWALITKRHIQCNCFGTLGPEGGTLGKTQLVWFLVWAAGVGIIWTYPPPSVTFEAATATAAVAALLTLCIRAIETLHAAHVSKGDRLSADRMLTWLH